MRGLTNVQLQRPTYLPPNALGAIAKKRSNLRRVPRSGVAEPALSDLSAVYPEAVVASSQDLGWQNLCAVQMRLPSEWTMPPLENHSVIVQLGPSLLVIGELNASCFAQIIQPGEAIIVPAGTAFHWRQYDSRPSETLHLYLHPHFVRTTAETMAFDAAQISLQQQFGTHDEHIHHIALSLHCELKEANVIGRAYADSLAKLLSMQLLRRYSESKDAHLSRGGMAPRKLRKAIDFIGENLDKEQTVALSAVAQEVQMSYFHFSRAFKQSTGVSPNVYMIEQRIERAKKLLSETEFPIADIALRVGFASQSHFTTTFRRLAWTTPKTFREMA